MKLSECTLGKIVERVKGLPDESYIVIGMIMGITQNGLDEAIPLVQFQDHSDEVPVHHDNLSIYEE